MRKRILSALLAAALCIGLMPGAIAAPAEYTDVPEDHWSAESVYRATELGIFQGIGNNLFGRGQAISRAAFVTALVRLFGWETVEPETPSFADVEKERWYYAAVETAVANGAIPVASRNFRPTDALTRGEMAALLMRALGYTSLAASIGADTCPFTDVTANRGFITMAYDMGIVNGVGNGTFAPNASATREQAAAILVRLYDRYMQESTLVTATIGNVVMRVEHMGVSEEDEMPTTPLEPIGELYKTLRAMKESGQNMDEVVLVLWAGGVSTVVTQGGTILSSNKVSKNHVDSVLRLPNVRCYYSERYESAYVVYEPNYYQTVTIWYQNEESLNAKLQLAKMFGVTKYFLE